MREDPPERDRDDVADRAGRVRRVRGVPRARRTHRGSSRLTGVRILAEVEALVGRLPHEPVASPARELGANHDFRPQPDRAPGYGARWRLGERRRIHDERLQGRQQLGADPVVEPGTDLACVAKGAVLVHADEQRTELHGLAGPAGHAAHDELLLGPDLDLLPGHGARAGHIGRVAILGHDPFEPANPGGLEEGDPIPGDVLAQAHPGIGSQRLGEQAPPGLERFVEQRPPVEP